MIWQKKGVIFDPTQHKMEGFDCPEFAVSPQALVFDDFARIYFSTRKKDAVSGKLASHITFVDVDHDFNIVGFAQKEVIPLGELGAFDEHGIFPINVLRHAGKIWAYTTGWSRRVSVPVDLATGLAFSHDDGLTFEKYGSGPVICASLHEPTLVGDAFVQVYDGVFHAWYIFGKPWGEVQENEGPIRCYKIAHATSPDGIHWEKEDGKAIIADVFGENENQALPTVLKIGSRYHMYFCFRQATDFRNNRDRGYRLGYAWSDDLKVWHRDDALGGMPLSDEGWDADMMCYPHIFEWQERIFLLYNGNAFGKYGFGYAELIQDN